MKPSTFTFFLLAVALVPAIVVAPAVAQVDLAQIGTGGFRSTFTSTQTRHTQTSNIVISVRDFSQTDDFCGNSVSFALPRPGSLGDGFDFPHAGRQTDGFSHPGKTITSFAGGATTYFQLPAGARNPDIIGCVDTQRNTVFITIKPQRQTDPPPLPPPPLPPQTEPTLPPIQTPSTQTPPNNPTGTYPQQRLILRQNQSFPVGGFLNNGVR